MPRLQLALSLLILLLPATAARADDFVNPKANIPPLAHPNRVGGGAGLPPLPLPGTSLRRSETKREPAPPALIGAITFSRSQLRGTGLDWQTTIIDIEKWVQFSNTTFGQRFRFVQTDFTHFSYDPTDLPILYFTGWQTLPHFDDQTILKLRTYLLDGGTWIV